MDRDALGIVLKRYNDMRSERDRFLSEWDVCDLQFEADTYEDNFGKLYVNNPIEQNLIEMELGRTSWLPLYDVVPDWYRAITQKLETAKYVIEYFIEKEQRWTENRRWRMDKAKYGTGIFFTGIRQDIDIVPTYKEKEEKNTVDAFWDQKQMVEETRTEWKFTPKNVPIRMFLMDDRAMWQSNFDRVQDCIQLEFLTKEELDQRYWDNKHFNKAELEEVVPSMIEEWEYGIQTRQPMVVLYHYFNKQDKSYVIVANKQNVLFDGKMIYPDGKLPFDVCQHYPNNSCLYGIGIPRKVRTEKAYTNNMQQYMIDGAKLSSGKILAMWGTGEPDDWQIYVGSGEISIARFSNWMESMKEINTQMDLNWPLAVLGKMDENIRKNTGIDLNSVFEPPADQLGTVEIIEENKQIRSKAVDELMDFAYQNVLTKMLMNLSTFAPKLLKTEKKIKGKDGKTIKIVSEYPTIEIPNVTIDKKWYIKTDMGEYGYLDFTPETLEGGMAVRVVTGTTQNTKMKVIERNKMTLFIQRYTELAQIVWPEKVEDIFPLEQLIKKWKVVEGFDDEILVADTKRDIIKEENLQKMEELKELLHWPQDNVQQNQAMGKSWLPRGNWQPQMPIGWPEAEAQKQMLWSTTVGEQTLWDGEIPEPL